MKSFTLKYYIGPAYRFAGSVIESVEKVAQTKAESGKREWPYRGITYKRVRHYGE